MSMKLRYQSASVRRIQAEVFILGVDFCEVVGKDSIVFLFALAREHLFVRKVAVF